MTRHPDDRLIGSTADGLIANHERLVEALNSAYAWLRDELVPRVSRLVVVTNPLLIPWRDVIAEKVAQALNYLTEVDQQLKTLLVSWSLPLRMWRTAPEWVSVRGTVSSVAGDLGATNREAHLRWKGIAADTYHAFIPAHVAAASRLSAVADQIQFALNWTASAAASMYAAVLGLIVGFIGAGLIALATAATIIGAVAGIVAIVLLVGTLLTSISSLIVTSAQSVGTARTWLTEMASEMQDNSAFPHGRWPAARPEWLGDATAADGDPSDWTVRA